MKSKDEILDDIWIDCPNDDLVKKCMDTYIDQETAKLKEELKESKRLLKLCAGSVGYNTHKAITDFLNKQQ